MDSADLFSHSIIASCSGTERTLILLLMFRVRAKSYSVTIQMKHLQQYFHMVLFNKYVVLNSESVDEISWCYYSNEFSSAVLSQDTIYLASSSNF